MAMLLDTFAVPRLQSRQGPLQIIQYDGPFKPKQVSRRVSSKAPSSEDKQRSDIAQHYKEDLLPMSRVVEVIDLTCLAGEGDPGISGGERDRGDIPLDGLFPEVDKHDAEAELIDSMLAFSEEKGNESSIQPRSCRDTIAAKEDSQAGSDIEECSSGLHEDDAELQRGDLPEVPTISTPEYHHAGSYIDTEDDTVSESDDSAKTSVGALQECTLSSTPPTSSSIEQPAQGRLPTIDISSSSGTDTDTNDDGNTCDKTSPLTRKRKRSANIRMLYTKSKRPSKHIRRSLMQQKLSTSRGRPTSNGTATRRSLPTLPYSGYAAGDYSSNDSSDEDSENRAPRVQGKQPISTVHRQYSHKHERKCSSDASYDDDDDEYEVERILDSRVNRGQLQYRAKWLGYENDPVWYPAENFKNSPHKLRDFHTANLVRPGPPNRLEVWLQCWEEGREADDHPNDNKP